MQTRGCEEGVLRFVEMDMRTSVIYGRVYSALVEKVLLEGNSDVGENMEVYLVGEVAGYILYIGSNIGPNLPNLSEFTKILGWLNYCLGCT